MSKDFLKDFEQRCWTDDIASFARWKELRDKATIPGIIESCKKNMQRIKDKYPTHLKNEII